MSEQEKEQLIDAFLAGWGGLKQTRQMARFYLEQSNWNVEQAQFAYWSQNVAIY